MIFVISPQLGYNWGLLETAILADILNKNTSQLKWVLKFLHMEYKLVIKILVNLVTDDLI